ncbi:MAG: HemK/PrmC family methyltransferase [Minisyncoccia bacterium]
MTRDEEWLLSEKYNGEKTEGFFTDCARLVSGEPLAYVIGEVPFIHSTIYLDSHPLIPRAETEFWVEKMIKEINLDSNLASTKVLDLCAGSGCIGISILSEVPTTHVDFCEIDVRHHATIQKNIAKNNIDPSRTNILGGDLFEQVTAEYDYIFSNPPYIDPVLDRTTVSVQKFEPSLALYGGKEGTDLIFKIIEQASQFLTLNGILTIEHEPEQKDAIHAHAKQYGFACATHVDQYGVDRYTVFTRK